MKRFLKLIALFCLSSAAAFAQNGSAPVYFSTTSTANPGTISPLFTGHTCVNQVAYDTSYNPAPLDPYTCAVDYTTLGGKSVGNNTCSGGSNDVTWSVNSDFTGFSEGGAFWLLYLNVSGAAAQVINTGQIPNTFSVLCPVAFSKVTDNFLLECGVQGQCDGAKNVISTSPSASIATTTLKDLSTCQGTQVEFPGRGTAS